MNLGHPLIPILRDPSKVAGYLKLAKAIGADNNAAACTVLYRRALLVEPLNVYANEQIFVIMRGTNLLALRRMVRCLITNPDSYYGLLFGGIHLRNKNRLAEAERLLTRAQAINPRASEPKEQLWKVRSNWGWEGRGMVGRFTLKDALDDDEQFYRTDTTRFFPRLREEFDDLDTVLQRDVFHGYLPERPLIPNDKPTVAMGSCFAQHIRQFLIRHGRLSEHVPIPEGLNNTFAVRQFVDWIEGRDELVFSYEKSTDGRMQRWDVDKDRGLFRAAMKSAGAFIVTIGVAEVWRDRLTGGVYWRGVPEDQYDPARHEHVLSTVEENIENLKAITDGLRRIAGEVPIVLTLSPVPLLATMQKGTSIFAADTVSKSILRLAIEAVVRAPGSHARYWPSFEAFRSLGAHLDQSMYDGEGNPRHPNTEMIGRIIKLFVDHYFDPARA